MWNFRLQWRMIKTVGMLKFVTQFIYLGVNWINHTSRVLWLQIIFLQIWFNSFENKMHIAHKIQWLCKCLTTQSDINSHWMSIAIWCTNKSPYLFTVIQNKKLKSIALTWIHFYDKLCNRYLIFKFKVSQNFICNWLSFHHKNMK